MFVVLLLLMFIMFCLVCCYLFYKIKLVEDDINVIYDEFYYYLGKDIKNSVEGRKKLDDFRRIC